MDKICKNCLYWNESDSNVIKNAKIGNCSMVKQFWDVTEWVENGKDEDGDDVFIRDSKKEFTHHKAFVKDGSDYFAELITKEEFGCNQWRSV